LTVDGQIALKFYDELILSRALSITIAALEERGTFDAEALNHIAVFIDEKITPSVPLLIVQNQPFTDNQPLSLGTVANEVGFTPLFLPDILAQPPLDAIVIGGQTFDEVIASSAFHQILDFFIIHTMIV